MSDKRTQGERAGDAGRSARDSIAIQLIELGRLAELCADTLSEYEAMPIGGLLRAAGDFACSIRVCDCGVLARPVIARYVVRRKEWARPLAVFLVTQNTSGSTDEKLPGLLWNAMGYCTIPSVLLLIGKHWERSEAAHTAWIKQQVGRRPGTLLRVIVGNAEFRSWLLDSMPWPEQTPSLFAGATG